MDSRSILHRDSVHKGDMMRQQHPILLNCIKALKLHLGLAVREVNVLNPPHLPYLLQTTLDLTIYNFSRLAFIFNLLLGLLLPAYY